MDYRYFSRIEKFSFACLNVINVKNNLSEKTEHEVKNLAVFK